MTDDSKTLVAAAVLAAAVGVYLEISYQEKLKTARPGQPSGAPSVSASSAWPASSAASSHAHSVRPR